MEFLPDIPMDYGPTPSVGFAVDEVKFGDGSTQRRPAGLNSVTETWSVSWSLLEQAEYDTLYQFLKSRLGVTPFLWQPPWEGTARKWVCTSLSGPRPTSARFASIQATFVEDHNP